MLFPHLISGAKTEDTAPSFTDADLLPTRPLKNVTGDISQLNSSGSALFPFPLLRKQSYFGFVDERGDSGGVRRAMPLVVNVNGEIFPSLDLQTIMQFWDADPDKVFVNIGHEVTLPKPDGTLAHIPIDRHGYMTINYRACVTRIFNHQAMSYSVDGQGSAGR